MSKRKASSNAGLTPRLRFPAFRNASPWEITPLEQMAERVATKNNDGRVTRVLTNSAEFGVLDQRNYFDKDIATAGKIDGYYMVSKGDYVYNPRTSALAPVGPISRNNLGEGVMSPLYTVFRFSDHQTDFYGHYFRSTGWHSYLRSVASTGARHDRMSITIGAFMHMPVPTPSPEEKQKIAECLTSLDEVIAVQGRKVTALKTHKRGLMQQLFPRAGETRPRLRFPQFRDAPEWEAKPLGEVAEIKLGKMLDANKHQSGRLLSYVSNIALRWNEVDTSDLPKMYFEKSEFKRYGLQDGDVLVCEGGEPGRAAVWDGRLPDLKFQKAIHRVRFRVPFVPKVLVLYLESIAGTPAFESLFTGGGIKHLTRETFSNLMTPVMSFPEQQRIADCLTSLDTRITAESDRLATLKTHKRGLMQQLFPAPEPSA